MIHKWELHIYIFNNYYIFNNIILIIYYYTSIIILFFSKIMFVREEIFTFILNFESIYAMMKHNVPIFFIVIELYIIVLIVFIIYKS